VVSPGARAGPSRSPSCTLGRAARAGPRHVPREFVAQALPRPGTTGAPRAPRTSLGREGARGDLPWRLARPPLVDRPRSRRGSNFSGAHPRCADSPRGPDRPRAIPRRALGRVRSAGRAEPPTSPAGPRTARSNVSVGFTVRTLAQPRTQVVVCATTFVDHLASARPPAVFSRRGEARGIGRVLTGARAGCAFEGRAGAGARARLARPRRRFSVRRRAWKLRRPQRSSRDMGPPGAGSLHLVAPGWVDVPMRHAVYRNVPLGAVIRGHHAVRVRRPEARRRSRRDGARPITLTRPACGDQGRRAPTFHVDGGGLEALSASTPRAPLGRARRRPNVAFEGHRPCPGGKPSTTDFEADTRDDRRYVCLDPSAEDHRPRRTPPAGGAPERPAPAAAARAPSPAGGHDAAAACGWVGTT